MIIGTCPGNVAGTLPGMDEGLLAVIAGRFDRERRERLAINDIINKERRPTTIILITIQIQMEAIFILER